MERYEVTGESLLSDLVAALVRHHRPSATIERADGNGEGAVRVRALATHRWMVVTCDAGTDTSLLQFLGEGAVGLVDLAATAEEFRHSLDAIDGVRPPQLSAAVLRKIASLGRRKEDIEVHLTPREREIVQLVAEGHSNREIAEALTISTNTVRTHLHALAVKLEAESRTKMIARARSLGLLSQREKYERGVEALGNGRHYANTGS